MFLFFLIINSYLLCFKHVVLQCSVEHFSISCEKKKRTNRITNKGAFPSTVMSIYETLFKTYLKSQLPQMSIQRKNNSVIRAA